MEFISALISARTPSPSPHKHLDLNRDQTRPDGVKKPTVTLGRGHEPRLGKVSIQKLVQAPTSPAVDCDYKRVSPRLRGSHSGPRVGSFVDVQAWVNGGARVVSPAFHS
jgi:hypothetical protein